MNEKSYLVSIHNIMVPIKLYELPFIEIWIINDRSLHYRWGWDTDESTSATYATSLEQAKKQGLELGDEMSKSMRNYYAKILQNKIEGEQISNTYAGEITRLLVNNKVKEAALKVMKGMITAPLYKEACIKDIAAISDTLLYLHCGIDGPDSIAAYKLAIQDIVDRWSGVWEE